MKIDFDGDDKILEQINNIILRLVNKKEQLVPIKKNEFSKNEFDLLTQKVDSRITSLDIELKSIDSKINKIDNTFNGDDVNENNIGVIKYNDLKKKNKRR